MKLGKNEVLNIAKVTNNHVMINLKSMLAAEGVISEKDFDQFLEVSKIKTVKELRGIVTIPEVLKLAEDCVLDKDKKEIDQQKIEESRRAPLQQINGRM